MVSQAFVGSDCLSDAEFWARYRLEIRNEAHSVNVFYNDIEKDPRWRYNFEFDDTSAEIKCRPKHQGDPQFGCYCYGWTKSDKSN